MQPWNLFGLKQISFIQMAGLSILFAGSFFNLMCLMRLYYRKSKNMEAYDNKKAFVVREKYISHWFVFMVLCLITSFIWSICAYFVTDKIGALIIGICGSICILSYFQAYLYFDCNEFDYFQDVEKLKRKIDKHNKDIDAMEQNKVEIQEKLKNGEIFLPDAEDQKEQEGDAEIA